MTIINAPDRSLTNQYISVDNASNEEAEYFWQEITDSQEKPDHKNYFYKEEWGPGNLHVEDIPAGLPMGSDWALIGGVCTRYKRKKPTQKQDE